jgi:tRNA (adenine57-N1/adenine58-N1)-methyltransferase
MIGHTGFLVAARRLADGTVLPPRRTRPSKGSYGDDYTGPGAVTVPSPASGADVPETLSPE